MHDARRHAVRSTRRLLLGGLTALLLSTVVVVVARPVSWSPLCAAYTPADVEWYLFFCYLDPPPKDPRT